MKWHGKILNDETKTNVAGKITIPNLSEENDLDEIDITITVDESNEKSEILKQFMYKIGRVKIREQIGEYLKSLKNDFAKNLILPKKDDVQVRKLNSKALRSLTNTNFCEGPEKFCTCRQPCQYEQGRY